MNEPAFFNRDLSWLSFNERVLLEARRAGVPLMERIRFLSIYSSNLDEFYRVRMPALLALQQMQKIPGGVSTYRNAASVIDLQQQLFGDTLVQQLLPELRKNGLHLLYNEPIPEFLNNRVDDFFFNQLAGFLQPVRLEAGVDFFPENNQLYLAAIIQQNAAKEQLVLVNIPCDHLSRFLRLEEAGTQYIIFLEDIIRRNLPQLFPDFNIKGGYNIKITRDAEMNLDDEYEEDVAAKIEKQLAKRDYGFATRFLYEPGIPLRHLEQIATTFKLEKASIVEGGRHHNLRDLSGLPIDAKPLSYPAWPALPLSIRQETLFDKISLEDQVIHVPYQSYDTVLRFFNEAAIDATVEEVYTTLYRVASDSRIVQALISAARNGKKVTVLVELKARFDEANNIRWAKKMKAEGVKINYSNNLLKVHAKIALVKRRHPTQPLLGLLATGNLNENTARFYTDHILLTAHTAMLSELQLLFGFLGKRKKPAAEDQLPFVHLLVAQFNLQRNFLALIDREIQYFREGRPAGIIIKMNNLEEEVLIKKLYEASAAGVQIRLLIRGICRLVPGVAGQSENITVRRIVDRFLEHGRVFIFENNGHPAVYLGSADWMNRNIYRRIEVCFPVYNAAINAQLRELMELQLRDNTQAVWLGTALENNPVEDDLPKLRSQAAIYQYLQSAKPVV